MAIGPSSSTAKHVVGSDLFRTLGGGNVGGKYLGVDVVFLPRRVVGDETRPIRLWVTIVPEVAVVVTPRRLFAVPSTVVFVAIVIVWMVRNFVRHVRKVRKRTMRIPNIVRRIGVGIVLVVTMR